MTSCIYQITNIITGKFYIGSTVDFTKRKDQHLSTLRKLKHANKKLQYSFNKHGEGVFMFSILEECSNLESREQFYIDSFKPYYNIFKTAYAVKGKNHPMFGRTHTPEARAKIKHARSMQIISHSPETRAKIGRMGRKMPEGHLQKMIAGRKGAWNKGIKTGIAPVTKIHHLDTDITIMYNAGLSMESIRKDLGVSWDVVKRVLTGNGVITRNISQKKKITDAGGSRISGIVVQYD